MRRCSLRNSGATPHLVDKVRYRARLVAVVVAGIVPIVRPDVKGEHEDGRLRLGRTPTSHWIPTLGGAEALNGDQGVAGVVKLGDRVGPRRDVVESQRIERLALPNAIERGV